ncbi:hypothetical protein CEXT_40731 [Caerostris extrusa]|uniref:Uncharacterized protein n=1 Tax=Caerostris extrusa TaxID=172846 RepID=A0AAV4VYN6_CAEEX|nr:hypothetical protein CEXT_40731 [Caerostris extrusa]
MELYFLIHFKVQNRNFDNNISLLKAHFSSSEGTRDYGSQIPWPAETEGDPPEQDDCGPLPLGSGRVRGPLQSEHSAALYPHCMRHQQHRCLYSNPPPPARTLQAAPAAGMQRWSPGEPTEEAFSLQAPEAGAPKLPRTD